MELAISNATHLRQPRIGWDFLAQRIHDTAVTKGFWPPEGRNFGEMICLVHSEIAEAYEAAMDGLPDDKLPQYSGFSVEIADAIIRLLDTGRSRGIKFEHELMIAGKHIVNEYGSLEADLMKVHTALSLALEHNRKGRDDDTNVSIVAAVALLLSISAKFAIDILEVIEAKMAFNNTRPYKHGKAY
jgi:hypothetical protein